MLDQTSNVSEESFEAYCKRMNEMARGSPYDYEQQVTSDRLGQLAIVPAAATVHASRAGMLGTQIGQRVVTEGAKPAPVQTGLEDSFANYTFKLVFEHTCFVRKVCYKDPSRSITNAIILIEEFIEGEDDTRLSMIDIKPYSLEHTSIGFQYKFTDAIKRIRAGARFEAGTIIAHSPNVDLSLGYHASHGYLVYNVAMTSGEGVAEDAMEVCESALEKAAFYTYDTVNIYVGPDQIALNLYGTEDRWQPMPRVGEAVRDDGILMAVRSITDARSMPSGLSNTNTMAPDTFSDYCYNVGPGGVVVALTIHMDEKTNPAAPTVMNEFDLQHGWRRAMLQKIYDYCDQAEAAVRSTRGTLRCSNELMRLRKEAYAVLHRHKRRPGEAGTHRLIYKHDKVEVAFITIVVRHRVVPNAAFKFTDLYASKGVVNWKIVPDSEMPYDPITGIRADMVVSTASTVSRQNPGRAIAHELGAVNQKMTTYIRAVVQSHVGPVNFDDDLSIHEAVRKLVATRPDVVAELVKIDMEMLAIGDENIAPLCKREDFPTDKPKFLATRLRHGCIISLPNGMNTSFEAIRDAYKADDRFRPHIGPVCWDKDGITLTSKYPILIAPMAIILLEKIPEVSACSFPIRNGEGVPAQLSRAYTRGMPVKKQAGRTEGEAEERNQSDAASGLYRERYDVANSNAVARYAAGVVLTAPQPTNIAQMIDRNKIEFGNTKVATSTRHLFAVWGFEVAYVQNR
jgi:hypothetical protein